MDFKRWEPELPLKQYCAAIYVLLMPPTEKFTSI